MTEGKVARRQHAVNSDPRPPRTAVGETFTNLVLQVALLGGRFTEIGEELAHHGGQTLARWVVLDAVAVDSATVSEIARLRGYARQSVQRVADLLVQEGLAAYEDNPAHQRAKLLRLTGQGRNVLRTISIRQKAWADAVSADIGHEDLEAARSVIGRIAEIVGRHQP